MLNKSNLFKSSDTSSSTNPTILILWLQKVWVNGYPFILFSPLLKRVGISICSYMNICRYFGFDSILLDKFCLKRHTLVSFFCWPFWIYRARYLITEFWVIYSTLLSLPSYFHSLSLLVSLFLFISHHQWYISFLSFVLLSLLV